jgi:CheY-like chemotaxis protein
MTAKRRILLVDDELTILLTLKAVLERSGYEVETAASGREGRSRIKHHIYDMVITDMRMEQEDAGIEVIQAAKKAPYQPAIAMLTAFPLPGSEWESDGADTMLVKPMNIQNLLTQLETLLAGHEAKKAKMRSAAEGNPAAAAGGGSDALARA